MTVKINVPAAADADVNHKIADPCGWSCAIFLYGTIAIFCVAGTLSITMTFASLVKEHYQEFAEPSQQHGEIDPLGEDGPCDFDLVGLQGPPGMDGPRGPTGSPGTDGAYLEPEVKEKKNPGVSGEQPEGTDGVPGKPDRSHRIGDKTILICEPGPDGTISCRSVD